MRVRIRFFARLSEIVGERDVPLELNEGSTILDLHSKLACQYPAVAPYLSTSVCAVGEEYVREEHRLQDGDVVALIPPVSGGSLAELGPFRVTNLPIEANEIIEHIRQDESGALVMFHGVARNNSDGRRVVALQYDAYASMAERKLRDIAEEIAGRWPITGIGILHRIGQLNIGEASLLVGVSAGHRAEAFEACHHAVDRIKQIVPIWKKEIWESGDGEWVAGHAIEQSAAGPPSTR